MPYIFRRRPDRIQLQTDNPDLEVWFWLLEDQSEYSSRQKLARNYEAEGIEVQSDQLHQTANYFSCCIRQAREYYAAAQRVSLVTRPLVLFYGMVCLAKTVIMLRKPGLPK